MRETRSGIAGECEGIWREALARTQAFRLVGAALATEPPPPGPVRLLAIGKAAASMMGAALAALGDRARDPLCVLPHGVAAPAGARAIAASHPRPDAGSLAAGAAVLEWARAGGGAPAVVLVSGGGSALAVAPLRGPDRPLAFEEKVEATALLMRSGATIQELNALRKHLSELKGGRLGAMLAPAAVRVLVMSDVPGDDLSSIASGPLVPDPTRWEDVFRILQARGVWERLPERTRRFMEAARDAGIETPKPGDPRFGSVAHRLLAGPVDLARAAAGAARERGFDAEVEPTPLTGDVAEVAARLGAWARAHAGGGRRLLALGGEPTIAVPPGAANADGGRAQHLALLSALEIAGLRAAVLAAGSDGRDGPTEQAGAVVDGDTVAAARASGLDLGAALAEARSGPAALAVGAAIPREDTGTHLCDLVLVAVE